jgi:hypothetical protein
LVEARLAHAHGRALGHGILQFVHEIKVNNESRSFEVEVFAMAKSRGKINNGHVLLR